MIGIIAAVSRKGVIGVDGKIPWNYPDDMKRFKSITEGSTVIMGRLTWESIPKKFRPLKGRTNIVVTSCLDVRESGEIGAPSVEGAMAYAALSGGDVWFIGGARIYAEAMQYADVIDLTYVPDDVPTEGAVMFPHVPICDFRQTSWGATGPLEHSRLIRCGKLAALKGKYA